MRFKRNQIEEAIARHLGEEGEPSQELKIKLKRLLDADRTIGRNPRATDPTKANFAFYSSVAPGKGTEVEFTEYEAFALFTSLRLLMHGFPQGAAVEILRHVRRDLELEHRRILRLDQQELFDQEAIRRNAKPGDLAHHITTPSFFVITSGRGENGLAGAVCPSEVSAFAQGKRSGQPWTMFELVAPAFGLRKRLLQTEPRKRGRG
jgi:hypothetical protein